ncbi:MAG: hypothetical protein AB7Q17_01220 [Phycisphaerae bacterium]
MRHVHRSLGLLAVGLTPLATSATPDVRDAAELVLARLAQRPALCASMQWNGYSVAKPLDFLNTGNWVQPVAPDGRVPRYDIDLCVLGEEFRASAVGPFDNYVNHQISWVAGRASSLTDENGVAQRSESTKANSGLPYTVNFMTLIDGWLIQEEVGLPDLARRGAIRTISESGGQVQFEARDPAWAEGHALCGTLDLARGGMPTSLSIQHGSDGAFHAEYRVFESQAVGGVHMPTRAVVAWGNAEAPTWVQEFTVLAWRVDASVTRATLALGGGASAAIPVVAAADAPPRANAGLGLSGGGRALMTGGGAAVALVLAAVAVQRARRQRARSLALRC